MLCLAQESTHFYSFCFHLGVEPKIGGKPPKSSILIGCSIINHPFWDSPIFGNTHSQDVLILLTFLTQNLVVFDQFPSSHSALSCINNVTSLAKACKVKRYPNVACLQPNPAKPLRICSSKQSWDRVFFRE